jgi:L-ascorbate metabolism protein UlaG (beta-lactamase superfamily)
MRRNCGHSDTAFASRPAGRRAARSPSLDANLTLDSDQAARAAQLLDGGVVIPVHTEGWQHFTQGPDTITDAVARRGEQERLVLLGPGESTTL